MNKDLEEAVVKCEICAEFQAKIVIADAPNTWSTMEPSFLQLVHPEI